MIFDFLMSGLDPVFGTKKDLVSGMNAGSAGVGFMPFIQMMLALGIVFVLIKYGLPKLLPKLSKKLIAGDTGGIRIEESASFAGGHLYIVNARGKTLLLSAAQSGVTCLADLTEPASKAEEAPLFMDVLEKEMKSPHSEQHLAAPAVTPAVPGPLSDSDIQEALDRLSRLGL